VLEPACSLRSASGRARERSVRHHNSALVGTVLDGLRVASDNVTSNACFRQGGRHWSGAAILHSICELRRANEWPFWTAAELTATLSAVGAGSDSGSEADVQSALPQSPASMNARPARRPRVPAADPDAMELAADDMHATAPAVRRRPGRSDADSSAPAVATAGCRMVDDDDEQDTWQDADLEELAALQAAAAAPMPLLTGDAAVPDRERQRRRSAAAKAAASTAVHAAESARRAAATAAARTAAESQAAAAYRPHGAPHNPHESTRRLRNAASILREARTGTTEPLCLVRRSLAVGTEGRITVRTELNRPAPGDTIRFGLSCAYSLLHDSSFPVGAEIVNTYATLIVQRNQRRLRDFPADVKPLAIFSPALCALLMRGHTAGLARATTTGAAAGGHDAGLPAVNVGPGAATGAAVGAAAGWLTASARQEAETTLASGDADWQICAAGEDSVNGDNIGCLRDGQWLSDEIINVWLALVKRSSDASRHGGPDSLPPGLHHAQHLLHQADE
jgi:hypothetical protein